MRFRCLFVLWSQRQAERTRQRLKPCGRERQILRRPPPPPPAGHAGLALASRAGSELSLGGRQAGVFFLSKGRRGEGLGGGGGSAGWPFLVQYCHQEEKVFCQSREPCTLPPWRGATGGVKEVWSKGQYPWEVKSSARRCLGAGSGVRPRGRCRDRPRDLVAAMSHVRAGLEEAGGSGGAPARGRGHLSWRSPSRPS